MVLFQSPDYVSKVEVVEYSNNYGTYTAEYTTRHYKCTTTQGLSFISEELVVPGLPLKITVETV